MLCQRQIIEQLRNRSFSANMPSPRPSLTLTLLQARETAMRFFRPQLNLHDLTEQQWRVIRILRQQGELENHQRVWPASSNRA